MDPACPPITPTITTTPSPLARRRGKKDPKPDEARPGDWQCACGNYNFSWRKECNACAKPKPFNETEEEFKQKELARIKEERAKRRAMQSASQDDQDRNRDRLDRNREINRELERKRASRDRRSKDRDRSRDRD